MGVYTCILWPWEILVHFRIRPQSQEMFSFKVPRPKPGLRCYLDMCTWRTHANMLSGVFANFLFCVHTMRMPKAVPEWRTWLSHESSVWLSVQNRPKEKGRYQFRFALFVALTKRTSKIESRAQTEEPRYKEPPMCFLGVVWGVILDSSIKTTDAYKNFLLCQRMWIPKAENCLFRLKILTQKPSMRMKDTNGFLNQKRMLWLTFDVSDIVKQ